MWWTARLHTALAAGESCAAWLPSHPRFCSVTRSRYPGWGNKDLICSVPSSWISAPLWRSWNSLLHCHKWNRLICISELKGFCVSITAMSSIDLRNWDDYYFSFNQAFAYLDADWTDPKRFPKGKNKYLVLQLRQYQYCAPSMSVKKKYLYMFNL